jgi:hypothetical protein
VIIGQRCDNTVRDGRVEYTTVSTSHTSVVLKANRNRRQSVGRLLLKWKGSSRGNSQSPSWVLSQCLTPQIGSNHPVPSCHPSLGLDFLSSHLFQALHHL